MAIAFKMQHAADPKAEILSKIGDISGLEVMHNRILVAVYVRPEKTAGGLFLPDKTRQEDVWQGKVGLVLAKGPQAFKDDATVSFAGQNVEPGDWVCFRVSDGWSLIVKGMECRMLEEISIRARIPAPDYVW